MKPIIDCHVHTNFSADSVATPLSMVTAAIDKGVQYLSVTDHMDVDYYDPTFIQFNKQQYFDEISSLKRQFADKININVGLEVGFTAANAASNAEILAQLPFDYIITSVHHVGDYDCYDKRYYDGKTREQAIGDYFAAVLSSVRVPYRYDAVGHIGYVMRTLPEEYFPLRPQDYHSVLVKAFESIVARGAIVELNTSTLTLPFPCLPTEDFLKIYHAVGGRKICFSSDAHSPERIGHGYDEAVRLARSIGFDCWTVVHGGKQITVEF